MKKIIVLALILGLGIFTRAQKTELLLQPQVSLLNGSSGVGGAISFLTGVSAGKWQVALGTGFDYYEFRTIPFFVEGKRIWGNDRKRPFVYAGLGYSIAAPLPSEKRYPSSWWWGNPGIPAEYTGGSFTEAGLGVLLLGKKGKGFSLAAGYTGKIVNESWMEEIWDPVESTRIDSRRSARYILSRIEIRVGFRIF